MRLRPSVQKLILAVSALGLIGVAVGTLLWPTTPKIPEEVLARLEMPSYRPPVPPPPPDPPPPGEPPTRDKLPEYHRILDAARDSGGGVHDACIALIEVGDPSSTPHLIRVLSVFTEKDGDKQSHVCTWGHCIQALERITGQRLGYSYDSWRGWWERTHPADTSDRPPNTRLNPPVGSVTGLAHASPAPAPPAG